MPISMAVVPLLKGKAADGIIQDFKNSKSRSYSDAERQKTNAAIAEILRQTRKERSNEQTNSNSNVR